MPVSRRTEWAILAALLAAYLLLLGRALSYDFVWDDVREIEHNAAFDRPLLEGLGQTQTARTDRALTELSTIELAYDSYRPLLFASLWVDVQLWGRAPVPLHAVNLLLGALAILLAYALARRWIGGPLALVPTAMFALHPIQIEAVAYISGRADVLAGVFVLAASLAALRALDARERTRAAGWTALAALSFLASLLSKEAYVGLPVVIAAVALVERTLRARWWVPAVLVVAALGYFVLRAAIVTSTTGTALAGGVLGLPGVWLEYLRILVLPFDLSTERLRHPAFAIPGAALALGLLVGFGLAARRAALSREARTALAGLVWTAILIAPAAVPIASTGVVADRYFYAPIFGLALALTAGARWLVAHRPRIRTPLAIAGGLAVVVWIAVSVIQVPVWQNNRTLYAHAVTMAPDSSMAHYRVGFLLALAGEWPDAAERFERAIELDPDNVVALNNLGVARLRTGEPARAAVALAHATEVNPAHFRAWLNLGLAQLSTGDKARGCASIARSLAINAGYAAALREHAARCQN